MRDAFQGLRGLSQQVDTDSWHIEGPWMAAWVVRRLLAGKPEECTVVLVLDQDHRLVRAAVVARGWVQAARMTARTVVLETRAESKAASFILGRNRLGAETQPHPSDVRIARMLRHSPKVAGLPLLDHVIVGRNGRYWSEVEENGLRGSAEFRRNEQSQ